MRVKSREKQLGWDAARHSSKMSIDEKNGVDDVDNVDYDLTSTDGGNCSFFSG